MQEVYSAFGVSEGSQGFIGHGLAMHSSNVYLEGDCKPTFKRIRKYVKISCIPSHLVILTAFQKVSHLRFYIQLEERLPSVKCLKRNFMNLDQIAIFS